MTQLPNVNLNIQDGNLGVLPPSGAGVHAKIGVSSAGPTNTIVSTTSSRQLVGLGTGPLTAAVSIALAEAQPVYAVRAVAGVAGTLSAVTKTGAGTSVVTVAGAPLDAYAVRVVITRGDANVRSGSAAFTYTINGSTSNEKAVPTSGVYELPGNGITITFGLGSAEVGDTHTFTSTAPAMTLANLSDAMDALLADPRGMRFIHVLGVATPAIATAMDVKLQQAADRHRWLRIWLEASPRAAGETYAAWQARITAEWAGYASPEGRVVVWAGEADVFNPLTNRFEPRNAAWVASGRRASRPVGEDLARVRTGPLIGVSRLYHDEDATPGLDDVRFSTLRTFQGRQGVYVASGRTMAPSGSDYDLLQNGEVMDAACRAAYVAASNYIGESALVDLTTGFILETEALAFEAFVAGVVAAELGGNVSGVMVRVDRTVNILSTRRFEFDLGVIPLGYMRQIIGRIGFTNPALQAALGGGAGAVTDAGGAGGNA